MKIKLKSIIAAIMVIPCISIFSACKKGNNSPSGPTVEEKAIATLNTAYTNLAVEKSQTLTQETLKKVESVTTPEMTPEAKSYLNQIGIIPQQSNNKSKEITAYNKDTKTGFNEFYTFNTETNDYNKRYSSYIALNNTDYILKDENSQFYFVDESHASLQYFENTLTKLDLSIIQLSKGEDFVNYINEMFMRDNLNNVFFDKNNLNTTIKYIENEGLFIATATISIKEFTLTINNHYDFKVTGGATYVLKFNSNSLIELNKDSNIIMSYDVVYEKNDLPQEGASEENHTEEYKLENIYTQSETHVLTTEFDTDEYQANITENNFEGKTPSYMFTDIEVYIDGIGFVGTLENPSNPYGSFTYKSMFDISIANRFAENMGLVITGGKWYFDEEYTSEFSTQSITLPSRVLKLYAKATVNPNYAVVIVQKKYKFEETLSQYLEGFEIDDAGENFYYYMEDRELIMESTTLNGEPVDSTQEKFELEAGKIYIVRYNYL